MEYIGDFEIYTQSDVVPISGHTSISGFLNMECMSCTDLSVLFCLTSVGGGLTISGNNALPDCEACAFPRSLVEYSHVKKGLGMRYFIIVGLAATISAGCWSQQEIVVGNDTSADTDTDADSDSDTDTDADTDSDSDADTDTNTDTGTIECNLGTYGGVFEITTQTDVATLAGYTSISGSLTIDCPSCNDLGELICLTSVGGGLLISFNDALSNLNGLSVLTSLDGCLSVYSNDALTNLDGLSGITGPVSWVTIYGNDVLANLDGLSGINSVVGDVLISNNDALNDLNGLGALTSAVLFRIYENGALTSLDGLGALTMVDLLEIYGNDILTDLDGLNSLTTVSGNLEIRDNTNLVSLDGLSALTSVDCELEIYENTNLPDCEVCDVLDQITSGPTTIDVHSNLADTCTPVPGNCP